MKTRSIGIARFVERCARMACRLGAVAAFVLGASAAFAQNLAVTTLASGFNNPYGVAVDASGNAYVADTTNHVIRKITSGGVVSVLAGSVGTATWADDASANAPAARFNEPRGIAINSAGTTLYVADRLNQRIRVIGLAGVGGAVTGVTTLAGTGATGSANAGAGSTFDSPVGIAINPAGDTLYIADRNNHLIRSIVISGPTVSTVAGLVGNITFANGNSATATFNQPSGIVVNAGGTALFVADRGNHLIRQIVLSPVAVTTYAGIQGTPGAVNNAVGTSATFNFPTGVAADASDNLYVADSVNNAVRQVAAAGTNAVSTPAGGTAGSADGTGSAAQFSGPNGIAVKTISSTLFVFVADTNNQTVRKAAVPAAATVSSPANQSGAVGANGITFTATVTGGWPTPTLQWQRQPGGVGAFQALANNSNYSGVTTGTLTVNGLTLGMSGDKFKLVATNASGTAESATPATLTVNQAPSFATSTVTFNATVGQAANFANTATGTAPITYAVTTGSLGIFSLNTSTGAITGTPGSTADSTTVVITASNGILPNATITVTINAVITAPPVISVHPQPQTVAPGATTAAFSVTASGTPAITGYQWQRQIGGVGSFSAISNGTVGSTTFSGATTAALSITGVTPAMNTDVFRVVVTNSVGSTTSNTAPLTVQGTAPAIASSPSSTVVGLGVNASFTGSATGNPTPTVRWQRQANGTGGFFDITESAPYSGTTTGTLTVTGVTSIMNGDQFQLVATNAHGTATTSTATLSVTSSLPLISVNPQNTTVNVTQNASFSAAAIGSPSPTLRWQRQPNGQFGFSDLNDDATYSGTTSGTLTITNATALMNGDQFKVVATNINGSATSSAATLTVASSAPTITLNPIAATVNSGQNTTFTGNATGVPAPTLRWERQPSGTSGFVALSDDATYSGTTTTTLTVANITAGMSGDVFRLVATNTGGSTPSTSAILTVNLGTTITTFAGLATVTGTVDGTGVAARFNSPASIVVDTSGNFYIADTGNSVIRKMTPSGVVTTLAGLAGSRGSVDGTGSDARFNSPGGVAVDGVGNVFVADTFSHTIRVVTPSGAVTTLAGSPSSSGGLDGLGSAARFFLPTGVAVDGSGTLYVADSGNHAIRRITSGGNVTTYAGALGSPGFVNSASPTSARFNSPNSLVVDSGGNVFVADSQNHAIRKISALGNVNSVAGSLTGTIGSSDGNGTLATFFRPSGLALDSAGNLFVADTNNNLIRRISTAGDVVTLAGLGGSSGSADGVGSVARFSRPFGIAVDSTGNIYVADTGNNTIRRSGSTSPVQITTSPGNRVAGLGQTATFSVVATGVPSPSSYQWQRQPASTVGFVNLAADSTYTGVNSATLTVVNVTQLMTGDQFRVVVSNGVVPAATSDAATLTVGVPPAFTSAVAASFRAGQANSFTVTADSTTTITYSAAGLPAWLTLNASTGVLSGNPPDTTGSPLALTITANNGVTATQSFTLTLLPANLPASVATQPASQTIDPGQSVTFSVTAAGTAPFAYQWRRNGIAISGATNPTLILTGVQAAGAGTYTVAITNAFGTAVSAGVSLTVNQLPIIAESPRPVVVLVGGSASFSVRATGGSSFTYQWRKNGAPVLGATSSTYTLNGVSASDVGNYDVIVTNNVGSVGSSLAQLTVATAPAAPVIVAQPAAATALLGNPVTLSVAVTGAPTPTLQWRKNGTAISGANGSTLSFSSAQASDAANYDVVATNSAGTVTSNLAGLTILTRSYAGTYFGSFSGALGNFALYVRDDNRAVFLGYLPGGTAPVMNLKLTVSDGGQFSFSQVANASSVGGDGEPFRAAALAAVTVTGSIQSDGTLTGAISGGASGTLSGTLAGATGGTQGVAGFYQVGSPTNAVTAYLIAGPNNQAFAIVLGGGTASDGGLGTLTSSGQVGIVTSRSTINLTIVAGSGLVTGSSTGAVVAASLSGGSETALGRQRLVNISSRARVGTADAVAIAGFVISGEESKPVLIRAVGPTLGAAPFSLAGALTSPRLELFRGATSIGTNTGIAGNRAAIDAAGAQIGAFALGAAGTDAAIFTTLAPGNYTAIVSSTTATAGVALIEVYDLSAPAPGQKLLNISTRASVGAGDNLLIAGFVVPAGSSKRVLVRGIGPGLAQFGVTGVIAQPVLTLFNGSASVASNTNWSTSADAAAITAGSVQVGAFGLANNDSAMVLTLAPGNYTAQVTGVAGGTGVALIEVYELP